MGKTPSSIVLPDRATIVSELEFTPPRPLRARGRAGAGVPPGAAPSTPERYRIVNTNEVDAYETPLQDHEAAVLGLNRVQTPGDFFGGTDRKAAKLTISTAKVEVFPDVSALIVSLPKAKPKVTKHSARVKDEDRNVRVRGFLYAASREGDNDFHFIVGDDPKRGAKVRMMTMELSGLPSDKHSPAFARMQAARDAYTRFLKAIYRGLHTPAMSRQFRSRSRAHSSTMSPTLRARTPGRKSYSPTCQ